MVTTPKLSHVLHLHFFFHNAQNNLAKALTTGRERLYLQHFYERLAFRQEAIGLKDLKPLCGQLRSGWRHACRL